ncbi:T9SS type A sorting domain-containing protein [Pontibacter sp. H249]|uniref:T9SS type A sorting domain-containing protein n=1 Tax=Pontibacter sp. H249 TaxID=3133420 RepID=UPI0030C09FCC
MKKVFTLLLFAAAVLLHPGLQAQKITHPSQNAVFKAALERAQKIAGAKDARFASIAQTVRVPQREVMSTWTGTQWQDDVRIDYTYNNRGLLETVTEIELPSNTNSAQYIYTYDSQGTPTELIVKEWNGSAWVNSSRITIELEGELIKSFGIYGWDGNAWALAIGERSNHTYTNNRVTETITEINSTNPQAPTNGWVLAERITYGYTGSDNRPTSITTFERQDPNWVEVERETEITYEGSTNDRKSYIYEEFDAQNSVWNKYNYTLTYSQNAANQTRTVVETVSEVVGSTTTPSLRTTTTYLTSGEVYVTVPYVAYLEEEYVNGNWVRSTEEKATVTRGSSGEITQIVVQEFDAGTNAFVNVERFTYSDFINITITSAADDVLAQATEVYPNPTQGALRISLDAAKVRNATLNIYSITGQKVYELNKLPATTSVDISKLPAGIYMVRIADDNNASVTRRVVKQ